MTTLRYLDEVLAGYPDNTQGLIAPVNTRDHVISCTTAVGLLVDSTQITIPITDGVPTIINPLLVAPVHSTQLWTFDGANLATPNYSAVPGLTVPPGYSKLVTFVIVLSLTKAAGGVDSYSISLTKDGGLIGLDEFIEFPAAGAQVVTVIATDIADVSATPAYGVAITGQGTSDDLELHTLELRVTDDILLSAP